MIPVLVVSRQAKQYQMLLETDTLPDAKTRYADSLEAALPHAAEAEVLFGAPDLLSSLLAHCPSLRWVQSSWAGVTPLIEAPRRDYLLTGVKDIFGQPMAEYVLGWLLALERNIPERHRARHWDNRPDGSTAGKQLGIMGTGSIGTAVAAGGVTPKRSMTEAPEAARGLNSDGRKVEGFDACYPMTERLAFADGLDYLVSVLPDTPATDRAVDSDMLNRLAPGAIFINVGRGNAVDIPALLDALESGSLRHAVLDVLPEEPLPDSDPLWTLPGLSITSHTAAPTPAEAIVDIFRDNFRRYRAGEALRYPVDFERGY